MAALMLALHFTTVVIGEVYVDGAIVAGIESATVTADLRLILGGRLADLHTAGVHGEEAAEHLREIARD